MFLKRLKRHKQGKAHIHWALMRSERTAKGPRHRLIAYLGELKKGEASGFAQLAATLEHKQHPGPSLFDVPCGPETPDDEIVKVRLKGVRLDRVRDFGDVWMGYGLWRMVGLDTKLSELLPAGREEVPWPIVAQILTIARLCSPGSELSIEQRWYPATALEDILGVPAGKVHTDRLYAGLDKLLAHKDEIEKHIKRRMEGLFDLKFDVLLYDITSSFFEGGCADNTMAKRGHSRDNRPDCPQVCIGLVATPEGIPLAHEVFDGNRHDSKTVRTIVQTLESKYGKADRVFVMDRGMVSESNLDYIKAQGCRYLVGTPKASLRGFESHITAEGWKQVHEGVDVKLVPCPDGTTETYVLTRSADRTLKEKAMNERFIKRMRDGLEKLAKSAASGHLKDVATANQRLGRLKEQNARGSGAFDVTIGPGVAAASAAAGAAAAAGAEKIDSSPEKAKIRVTWTDNKQWAAWKALSEGCYVLRTNLQGATPEDLWRQYTRLTEVEAAFRTVKSDLGIRPIWHHGAERVKAHVLICFLAYVLWKTLGQWMKRAGLGDAPRTVLDELKKLKSGDVLLPVQCVQGRERLLRIRCVTEPEAPVKVLLNRLGVKLARRLRAADNVTELLPAELRV